ncbi:MAG: hypothetical protein NT178_10660 [Proteobacteria bacterium]|nr:hypothetical protein [Pseudomonadota bacterium]
MQLFLFITIITFGLSTFVYAGPSEKDCLKARSQIESERQSYQKIQSGEKSRRFYTGTSPWYAVIPEDLEYVWKAVDGGLPKAAQNYSGPAECLTVWSKGTFQDYEKCSWPQYMSRLEKLVSMCGSQKVEPYVQKESPPFLFESVIFESVRRLMEAKPPLQKAIQEIIGKDAFLVVRDNTGKFYAVNNKGKSMNIPESLSNKLAFSNKPALLPVLLPAEAPEEEIKEKERGFENTVRNLFPENYGKIISTYTAATYFSMDEFQAGVVGVLSKAIARDGYKIVLQKPDDSIERLNELLQMPNFYDIWREKNKMLSLEAEKLVYETQNYRQKRFSQLSESEAKNIVKLNRLILEATYPNICPKSLTKVKYRKSKSSDTEYAKIKDNVYDFKYLGPQAVFCSSEHSSVKGEVNGGGDFIKNTDKKTLLAFSNANDGSTAADFIKYPIILAASSSPEYVFILTPSAQMTLAGKAVVDVGYNGETGLLVLEGKARVKESVTGSEREVPAGSVVYAIPGFGISRTIKASEIKISRWWEGTDKRQDTTLTMPAVKEIVFATGVRDGKPVGVAGSFSPDTNPIYMWVRLDRTGLQGKIKSAWYFLSQKDPFFMGGEEINLNPNNNWAEFNYTLAPGKRWPTGEYKVVVSSGSKEIVAGSFRIADTSKPQSLDWVSILSKGNPVSVILDAVTDSNEKNWPLGTIKGGERYTVQYISSSGQWQATGYNKGTKAAGTWTYPGGKPENREFSIWGHVFRFDETGRVFDNQLGHVGRLLRLIPPGK